jgi:hypothetical protein
LAGATLKKNLKGIHHFCDSDYTRANLAPRLEICIVQIRFSDSLPGTLLGKPKPRFAAGFRRANLTPAIL